MGLVLSHGGFVSSRSGSYVGLRETLTLVQRQVEDLAWHNLAAEDNSIDLTYDDRKRVISEARTIARRNPLAKVAINLLQNYTLGQGLSVKAENRKLVAKVVDEFMDSPANEAVLTSHQAQKEFLETLYTDGDYFLVMFPDETLGTLELGYLDATFVEDSIPDPNNVKITKWYKVRRPDKAFNYERGAWETNTSGDFVYYRHYQNTDPAPPGMGGKLQPGLVMQVSVDRRGKFGRSQIAAAMDWLRAHKKFMEDRATINSAAAAVAWKKKRKGPASDIAAEAARLQSSLTQNIGRYESNPAGATASTIVENEATSLEWVKTDTGGSAADFDERKLRMMAGSGLGGIPNHMFGDEGQANLATATAMNTPLRKMYEQYQQVLRDVLLAVIDVLLETAHKAGRIGERDDEAKYRDRTTTPQGVMQDPLAVPAQTRVQTREALQMPYRSPPLPGGVRLIPRPEDAVDDSPATEDNPSKKISWYVDIDYPPMQDQTFDVYMSGLKSLSEIMPGENIESKKLVVELALTFLGVNDIDDTMERLFPPDMVAVLAPPPPPLPGEEDEGGAPSGARPPGPPRPGPVAESIAAIRRRRLMHLVESAADAIDVEEAV
jgi:hypothetical protein